MDVDSDSYNAFLGRVKMSQDQRKYAALAPFNPNPGYAIVHPSHAETLLIREIDQMSEDDVLEIFMPTFKDDIVSVRLYPPIPGTRGFAFIDFKDALSAIRAFTLKQRATITYKGAPKKIHLSRVTKGTTTDTESKWMKYQERQRRSDGQMDSTPRRRDMGIGASSQAPLVESRPFADHVTTVPFMEVVKAIGNESDVKGDSKGDRAEDSSRSRADDSTGSGARPTSPDRRRSPARSSTDRRSPARSSSYSDRRTDSYNRRFDDRDRRDSSARYGRDDRRDGRDARDDDRKRREPFGDRDREDDRKRQRPYDSRNSSSRNY